MRLPANGREYAKIPVNVPREVPLEVSFDGGLAWHPATRPSDDLAQILVAGPLTVLMPSGQPTVLLKLGYNPVTVRLAANPELVVREAGTIYVYLLKI